jgi:hypothetical protein
MLVVRARKAIMTHVVRFRKALSSLTSVPRKGWVATALSVIGLSVVDHIRPAS